MVDPALPFRVPSVTRSHLKPTDARYREATLGRLAAGMALRSCAGPTTASPLTARSARRRPWPASA
jgi:hypothetical protein